MKRAFTVEDIVEEKNAVQGELWVSLPPEEPKSSIFSEAGSSALERLRHYFANLDAKASANFWSLYRFYYGGRAAAGASRTVNAWLRGTVSLKGLTGNRVFRLAPAVMTVSQRASIFSEIVAYRFRIASSDELRFLPISEENLQESIEKIYSIIEDTPNRTARLIETVELPKDLAAYAKWLMNNDMSIVFTILKEHALTQSIARKDAASRDLDLFVRTIGQESREGQITIDLGDIKLCVSYHPKQKSLRPQTNLWIFAVASISILFILASL